MAYLKKKNTDLLQNGKSNMHEVCEIAEEMSGRVRGRVDKKTIAPSLATLLELLQCKHCLGNLLDLS